ncbi:MAG: hypothetical protein COA79_25230 [Planctomycetota bacterium]|nr:MAG: hypothetical protein COA79_25230 [Planctomycetota bacterium]
MIRKASLNDCIMLGQLNKHLIEDGKHPNTMDIDQLIDRMKHFINSEYTCYIYSLSDNIIAYCLFYGNSDFYYIRQLFVHRIHRKKGIATELLNWLFINTWVDKKVRLDVLANNHSAIEFYEKYGFKVDCLRMEK